jgi:cytosine/adenosine deaminase-related metal-dependent hydrolase
VSACVPSLRVVGAELVWTGTQEIPGATLSCRDGRIVEDAAGSSAAGPSVAGTVLDASGCIVTPGLVNAHHHLLQCAFRTMPDARHVPMRSWLSTMADAYRRAAVDPELAGAAALVGLAESLLCGVTTVADHHLTWPVGVDEAELGSAVAAAARRLGARIAFVRGSAGGDPEQAALGVEALLGALAVGPGGVSRDGMLQLAVGPAGVHSGGPETFAVFAELAARHGLRRRTQANEQVDVEVAEGRFGRRPLELLEEWGWLAPDVTVAHLCKITADEVRRVGVCGASATHAPGCDLPSGWGVSPVGALLDHGVTVGLGTSGGGSNDAGHLLADARLAMQVAPLGVPRGQAVTARVALAMATAGSALGLGRPELGSLEPGSVADLCCWDVSGVADAGVADPLAGLIWAGPGRRPRHVVVAGRVVVEDGRLTTGDEHDIVAGLARILGARTGEGDGP